MKTNAGQIENIFDFQIHYYLNQEDLHKIRQFGIRKFSKKLVISLLCCDFIVVNQ